MLLTAIEALLKKEIEHPEKDASRIKDNVRAVKTYIPHFARNKFTVLDTPKPKYQHGEVIVSATPDLYVDEGGRKSSSSWISICPNRTKKWSRSF